MSAATPTPGGPEITRVLQAVSQGEAGAAQRLLELVQDELHALARGRLARMRPGQTLQTTALVDDAWIRLVGGDDHGWESRAHFFGAASRAMRNILVEQARRKGASKRGGGRSAAIDLDVAEIAVSGPREALLDLDEALERLADRDPRQAEIVALRFFGGLEMKEVARVLGLSLRTVEHEWRFARSWLQREMRRTSHPGRG